MLLLRRSNDEGSKRNNKVGRLNKGSAKSAGGRRGGLLLAPRRISPVMKYDDSKIYLTNDKNRVTNDYDKCPDK